MAAENLPTSDYERAVALCNIVGAASDNRADLTPELEEDYRELRRAFMRTTLFRELLPDFVAKRMPLRSMLGLLRRAHPAEETRREFVEEQFQPLLSCLRGNDEQAAAAALLTDEEGDLPTLGDGASILIHALPPRIGIQDPKQQSRVRQLGDARPAASTAPNRPSGDISSPGLFVAPEENPSPTIAASGWTGRITARQQAQVVLSLAPSATEGVKSLLTDHEKRLHNRPPEPLPNEDLQALRDLHKALGDLIALAERGEPINEALTWVAELKERVFRFASETGDLAVAGFKPLLASQPAAWATYALLSLVCAPATFATLGPTAALMVCAGYFGVEMKRQPKP